MNSLGERIKEIRNDNGLTQQNFANQISVSRPFISRIEANKEVPSESLLKLICATFNVNILWLKNGLGNKQQQPIPYKQVQNEILNNEMLKNLVSIDEQKTFSFCCSILISILKNSNVKDGSNQFYQEKVKSLLGCV
ncbi:MAG: helix-turn-helix domain-containing protein [Hungatella sp.]|jgi:transcriptional regulator with XRE-family HTH domain|nr:helix-turn-helix domain-containing protein [Hungatella sp.]